MNELWLNFLDPQGSARRVRVDKDKFAIGRHPDCDLTVADSRLSRVHARIERLGDRFEISDQGSSNGTDLNGSPVFDPMPISDGSSISLGGFVVKAEIAQAQTAPAVASNGEPLQAAAPAAPIKKAAAAETSGGSDGIPVFLIFLAPVLAIFLVAAAGGAVYLLAVKNSGQVAIGNDEVDDPPDVKEKDPEETDDPKPTPRPTAGGNGTNPELDIPTPTPANLSENAKVEMNGTGFLRKIGANDSKVFMTGEQAKRLAAKVKQFAGSAALADNLNAAQKNADQIKALAAAKNLKPQFLAAAAVARLGNSKGDVVQTAQSMSEILDKLSVHLGTELADDCLLLIAAYDQGVAGETMKMRNMLQDLANKTNESSRTIRTIWFLQKQNKITQAEFDRALTFLAVGTIAQNPKEFNVNAAALNI